MDKININLSYDEGYRTSVFTQSHANLPQFFFNFRRSIMHMTIINRELVILSGLQTSQHVLHNSIINGNILESLTINLKYRQNHVLSHMVRRVVR